MKTTLELLGKATDKLGPISERALSQRLGHSATAITTAKQRGNLSPILAGQLAEIVGENVEHWMAVAVIEGTPKSRITDSLKRAITATRNS